MPLRHSFFVQWLARVLLGLGLAAVSLEIAWIFRNGWWQVLAACGAVAVAGVAVALHAEWHERRRRLLARARAALALPAQWTVRYDKVLPGGWVAPIAAIREDGMRFVVDIRGFRSATWSGDARPPGTAPRLVDAKDRPLRPDPVPALAAGALAAGAAPVLWLPRAPASGTFRHPDANLVVVTGSARDLKLALQSARRVTAQGAGPPGRLAPPAPEGRPRVARETRARGWLGGGLAALRRVWG